MGRRAKLIFGTFAAMAIAAVAFFAAWQSNTVNLLCTLGPAQPHILSRNPQSYAFQISIPKFFGEPRVRWANVNSLDFRVEFYDLGSVNFDDTMLMAALKKQLGHWPDLAPVAADVMIFRINRFTRVAQIDFFRNPLPGENTLREMKQDDMFEPPVMQSGKCSKSERAF